MPSLANTPPATSCDAPLLKPLSRPHRPAATTRTMTAGHARARSASSSTASPLNAANTICTRAHSTINAAATTKRRSVGTDATSSVAHAMGMASPCGCWNTLVTTRGAKVAPFTHDDGSSPLPGSARPQPSASNPASGPPVRSTTGIASGPLPAPVTTARS